jgi:cobalt-zinc-cadmium efflux system membrane fusion protein
MSPTMNKTAVIIAALLLAACQKDADMHTESEHGHADPVEEVVKGPNRGRMLTEGNFAIELAIFESGVPPEYHAWPTLDGKPVPLDQVQLSVELHRLGDKMDRFIFAPQGDYLRSDGVVAEPHSFVVKVTAQHAGKSYQWSYDSFEGRTRIAPDIAKSAGIGTEAAGPAKLVETLSLYGRIVADPARQREVTARYPGVIKQVHKKIGDRVAAGEALAVVESNESLQSYTVTAPIGGVIAARDANPGEHSADHVLFTIIDSSVVMAELAVFPKDRSRVKRGAAVQVRLTDAESAIVGKIDRIDVQAGANQSVQARATLDNSNGELLSGSFITAEVAVAEREVPLAVKTSALQPFRDFTVVFEQIGDQYEVRMLELGEQRGEWAEVLGGIEPGAQYVTENSYLIKADIEKSGASHDH